MVGRFLSKSRLKIDALMGNQILFYLQMLKCDQNALNKAHMKRFGQKVNFTKMFLILFEAFLH
jgi:hypothetical protein